MTLTTLRYYLPRLARQWWTAAGLVSSAAGYVASLVAGFQLPWLGLDRSIRDMPCGGAVSGVPEALGRERRLSALASAMGSVVDAGERRRLLADSAGIREARTALDDGPI